MLSITDICLCVVMWNAMVLHPRPPDHPWFIFGYICPLVRQQTSFWVDPSHLSCTECPYTLCLCYSNVTVWLISVRLCKILSMSGKSLVTSVTNHKFYLTKNVGDLRKNPMKNFKYLSSNWCHRPSFLRYVVLPIRILCFQSVFML